MLFFFKQKTAYEMRISDWSSDVCSSDLNRRLFAERRQGEQVEMADPARGLSHEAGQDQPIGHAARRRLGRDRRAFGALADDRQPHKIGKASWRERVCQYG